MPSKYTVTAAVKKAQKETAKKNKGRTGGKVLGTGRGALKRAMGRPTKYKPEYCQRVIELGKLGKAKIQMACDLDIEVDTLYAWCEKYPDFSGAMKKALQYQESWWIEKGREGMHGDFNTGPYSILTTNILGYVNNRTKQEVKAVVHTLESFLDSVAEDTEKG